MTRSFMTATFERCGRVFVFTLASGLGLLGTDTVSMSWLTALKVSGATTLLEFLVCMGVVFSGVGHPGPGVTETLAPKPPDGSGPE